MLFSLLFFPNSYVIYMQGKLLDWLNTDLFPDDIAQLSFNAKAEYLPIPTVRKKMDIMESVYGADITQTDVSIFAINTPPGKEADVIFTATVKFIIKHPEFKGGVKRICGTASFYIGQYSGWSFAQIAESLATVRAFSKQWKQFGRGLNEEEDPVKNFKTKDKKTDDKVGNTMKGILNKENK